MFLPCVALCTKSREGSSISPSIDRLRPAPLMAQIVVVHLR